MQSHTQPRPYGDHVKGSLLPSLLYLQVLVLKPAAFANVDIRVRVSGGGHASQVYAIRQAIGKAIVAYTAKYEDAAQALELKKALVSYDRTLLVADPRRCEPKKFGGPGQSHIRDGVAAIECHFQLHYAPFADASLLLSCYFCPYPPRYPSNTPFNAPTNHIITPTNTTQHEHSTIRYITTYTYYTAYLVALLHFEPSTPDNQPSTLIDNTNIDIQYYIKSINS